MPKTSKTKTPAAASAAPIPEQMPPVAGGDDQPLPSKKQPARARKAAPKKRATAATAKKRVGKGPGKSGTRSEPSDADIRLRAYFIAERRVQLALQGDPARDWLEAKQQLAEEGSAGAVRLTACRMAPEVSTSFSMDSRFTTLAAALRERLAIIANEESRRDSERHISRLRDVSRRIEQLRMQLPEPVDPQLKHYLQRASYDKALALLES